MSLKIGTYYLIKDNEQTTNKQEVLTDLIPKQSQTKFRFANCPTMVDVSAQDVCNTTASRTFDKILEIIQSSNLNFQLKISPFSALISLKKYLVKDKLGVPLSPPFNPKLTDISGDALAALIAKNLKLERDLETLRVNYEHSVDDCETSHQTIKTLQSQLHIVETAQIKIEAEEGPEKNILIDTLNEETWDLERKIM